MRTHIHDDFSESCEADPGLKSISKEGSTTVFLHETSLPGQQRASSAGYSYLSTHESSPPLSASMASHCLSTFATPSPMEAHKSDFHAISLTSHCIFKWSPRAAEARKTAGCRKRRGIRLEDGEGRKRRKLDESDLQAADWAFFASLEPQIESNTSMLNHTSQQLSHQQGVSMVAHCISVSFPISCSTHTLSGIVSLASHIVTDSKLSVSSSTLLVSFPGSLPPLTSFVSHMTSFNVSTPLEQRQPFVLSFPPSPGPRGKKRGGSDLEVKPEVNILSHLGFTLVFQVDLEHECTWCPERTMTALTPSHKRIRVVDLMDSKEKEGEISDEYEDADVDEKQWLVDDKRLCRKRKGIVANDLQSKSLKVEAELSHEEELLIQDDLTEEEIGLDVIKEHEEEKRISVKAVNLLDDEEQNTVEKEGQRMLTKSAYGNEESQKFDDDDQETFEKEILDEEDEMLAYLWPGSGRRSAV